jgi:hypothetical protein
MDKAGPTELANSGVTGHEGLFEKSSGTRSAICRPWAWGISVGTGIGPADGHRSSAGGKPYMAAGVNPGRPQSWPFRLAESADTDATSITGAFVSAWNSRLMAARMARSVTYLRMIAAMTWA